jgi:short-subunit dehydrogenase
MSTISYTWLITGASSGLGASLALSALHSGHAVIACSRDIAKAKKSIPEVERLRGTWLELDVNSDRAEEIISDAVELHHVNVLVNSAGFALRGRIEDVEYGAG